MLAEFKVTTLARHLPLDDSVKHDLINLCTIIRRDLKDLLGYLRTPELKKQYDERLVTRETLNEDFTAKIDNVILARELMEISIRNKNARDSSAESQTIEALYAEIEQLEARNRLLARQLLAAQQPTYSQQPQVLFAKTPTPPPTSPLSIGPKLVRTNDFQLPEIINVLKVFTFDEHRAVCASTGSSFTHVVFEFSTPENAKDFLAYHETNSLIIRHSNPAKDKNICTEFRLSYIDDIGKRLLVSTVHPDNFWPLLLECHANHTINHRNARPYQINPAIALMPVLHEAFDLENVSCHYYDGTQLHNNNWKLDRRDSIFVPHEVKNKFTLENLISRINEFANSENSATRQAAESLLKTYTHQPQPSATMQLSQRS